jgi:hypothetical protein
MPSFIASISWDCSSDTPQQARQLLRAELVGRRWKDRCNERPMPQNSLWSRRSSQGEQTTDDIHAACADDLSAAAAAVRRMGIPCRVVRAFIQVMGGGTFGLAKQEHLSPEGVS